jgi:carbamoyl-phosphate synthase large subunit
MRTSVGVQGLDASDEACGWQDGKPKNLKTALANPTDRRVFQIYRALAEGWPIDKIHAACGVDAWFIAKMKNVLDIENELRAGTPLG